jgi:L-alanine-DL-glutamate epimerase-like enolase superfamily enzyme
MRISQIHVYQHDLPVSGVGYSLAQGQMTQLDTTIVEIVTDSGLRGYGETCPLGSTCQPQHAKGAHASYG